MDFQFSHYNIGNNLAGGFWLGSSTYTANFNVNPIVIFTDSTGNSGGLCQEYPQSLTTLNTTPTIAQPSLGVTAFGFSTPALPTVQSYTPNIVELCPQEQLYLGPDTILCPNQSLTIGVIPSSSATYLWSTNGTGPSITVNQAGTYWLEVIQNGCPRRDTIVIDFHPDIDLLPTLNTSICLGDSLELSVPQGVNNWQWSTGSTDSSIVLQQGGIYTLSASTSFCDYTDSINLAIVNPPNISLGPDTSICPQSQYLLDVFRPGATYLWQDGSMQSDLTVVDSGLYAVEVILTPCVVRDSVNIDLRAVQKPNIGPDTTLCLGESLSLQNSILAQNSLWSDGSTADTLLISQANIYWLESFDGFCPARDSMELFILQDEAVDLGPDTTICAGEALVLDPGFPGTQHLWQGNIDQLSLSVDTTGWYWVQVIAPLCDDTDSIFVTVVEPPVVEIVEDSFRFCLGDSVFLDVADDPTLSYQWNDGLMGPDRWLAREGWYELLGVDSLCESRDSVYVSTPAVPVFSLGNDSSLCEGDSVLLIPDRQLGTLLWSDNSSESSLLVEQDGLYWLTQDVGGCSYSDSVQLSFLPFPLIDLGPDTSLCEGQSLLLGNASLPDLEYLWQDGSRQAQLLASVSGIYSLRATRGQCATTDEIQISFEAVPPFSLGIDTAYCTPDGGMLLSPELPAYLDLLWSDGSTEPTLFVEGPGIYSLNINTEVCGSLSDTIEIREYSCFCPLFFPSAFSPNQDGLNEVFSGIGDCQPLDYDFQVFNRWGGLMFSSREKEASWDGTFNGSPCPEGVYVWVARYRFRDRGGWREDFQRGTVSLIR